MSMVTLSRPLARSAWFLTGALALGGVVTLAACGENTDAGSGGAGGPAGGSSAGGSSTGGDLPDMTHAGTSAGGVGGGGTGSAGGGAGTGGASGGSGGAAGGAGMGGMLPDVSPEGDGDFTVGPNYM